MRRSSAATCEGVMMSAGGLIPIVSLLDHTVVPLINKAHAAGMRVDGKGLDNTMVRASVFPPINKTSVGASMHWVAHTAMWVRSSGVRLDLNVAAKSHGGASCWQSTNS
eukprot:1134265-Pelagomonas_calceolata.AAC.5